MEAVISKKLVKLLNSFKNKIEVKLLKDVFKLCCICLKIFHNYQTSKKVYFCNMLSQMFGSCDFIEVLKFIALKWSYVFGLFQKF